MEAAGAERYRLPTEAEWEYGCRAGTTTPWWFGDNAALLDEFAWYERNTLDAGLNYAQAVGTKRPNPWGLYDMYGNVAEWCQNWYGGLYSGEAEVDPTDPPAAGPVYTGVATT